MTETEKRLIEWGKEKFYPGWEEPSPSAVLARVMEEGRDARRKTNARRVRQLRDAAGRRERDTVPCKETRGVRMEVIQADEDGPVAVCPPDGNAARLVEKYASSIERMVRCRVLGEKLDMMPRILFLIVWHTYGNCVVPGEVPREAKEAANSIGISRATYFRRKGEMLDWLARELGLQVAAAA